MNWATIKSKCRVKLQDPNGKLWKDDELLIYVNDIINQITKDSEAHLKHVEIPLIDGQRVYDLPPDCWEVRGVRINGPKTFGVTSFDMEDYDSSYLTATGAPKYYYIDDPSQISFYPIPTVTDSLTTFNQEYGTMIQGSDSTADFVFTQEYGVVIDVIDTSMQTFYNVNPRFGVTIQYNEGIYIANIAYIYAPAFLAEDSDVTDLPTFVDYALIFGVVEKAFLREGQGQDLDSAMYYGLRKSGILNRWFGRNKEISRGQNQMISMLPVTWGSDLDWRKRVWP